MTDRAKVMFGLQLHVLSSKCEDNGQYCPYFASDECSLLLCKDALELLKEQKSERSDWISVKERMPVELHSIFWPLYGKKQWSNAMWREQSDKVLVTVVFKDGTRLVTTGETHDGKWNTSISRTLEHTVTHWMQFPELPRKGAKE